MLGKIDAPRGNRDSSLKVLAGDRIGSLVDWLDGRDVSLERLVRSLLLFPVLFAIYATYLKGFIEAAQQGTAGSGPDPLPTILKFIFFAGWPFALLAYFDKIWSGKDAARAPTRHPQRYGCTAMASIRALPD